MRINIGIASPGDVPEERAAVPKIVMRWNSRNDHATLNALMWEFASVPELGSHPQQVLDRQIVDKSDLLVAIFYSKLGTPTPSAPSGTVEEIREFIRVKGPRRVMLYFCTRSLPHDIDPAELAKLREFKAEMRSQGLYFEYLTVEQFVGDLYRHLDAKVKDYLEGKLPLPEPKTPSKDDLAKARLQSDPRMRAPIDFGTDVQTISAGFCKRMDEFDAIDGSGPNKYLDLGAHVFHSVAFCIDRFVRFSSAGIAEQDIAILERISNRLKVLGAASREKLSGGFPQYWKDGRQISNDLNAQVQYLARARR